jgi:hypothetical protein
MVGDEIVGIANSRPDVAGIYAEHDSAGIYVGLSGAGLHRPLRVAVPSSSRAVVAFG